MATKNVNIEECTEEKKRVWNQILKQSKDGTFEYLLTWIELCSMVNKQRYKQVKTCNKIISYNGKEIGIWTYTIASNGLNARLMSNETELIPPIFVDGVVDKAIENCINEVLEHTEKICIENQIKEFDTSFTMKKADIRIWHRLLLENEIISSRISNFKHLYYLNLEKENFYSAFRSTVRNSVKHGLKQWNGHVYDTITWGKMNDFRQFHERIKGRATRGIDTWKKQMESVNKGEAIVVILEDTSKQIVGGGIFYYSDKESYYNSAAYDKGSGRNYLGHTTQYLACQYFHEKGIAWHRLGDCLFVNEKTKPTEKERSISKFKSGFSSDIFVQINIHCEIAVLTNER